MENAIKKSIEGGYKYLGIYEFDIFQSDRSIWINMNVYPQIKQISHSDILLDPLFYQALVKQQGAEKLQSFTCMCGFCRVPEGQDPRIIWKDMIAEWWAHQAIQWIFQGKDINDFFNQLLK